MSPETDQDGGKRAAVQQREAPEGGQPRTVPEEIDHGDARKEDREHAGEDDRTDPDEDSNQAALFLVQIERKQLDSVMERADQVLAQTAEGRENSLRF